MRSRKEAVWYLNRILGGEDKELMWDLKHNKVHFGYVEFRQLLDFIYDGPPTDSEEFVVNKNGPEYRKPYK